MNGRDQIVDKRRSDVDLLISKSTATSSSRRHGIVKEFLPKGEISCSVDVTILALKSSVDTFVVPGLGSHPLGSFRSGEGIDVWLRDFLPKDIPAIRVLLYGYDSTLMDGDSKSSISDLGKAFLESTRAFRSETRTR